MGTTLSNGFVKPDNDDPGSVWMPDVADNVQRTNDHNHDGVNSNTISPASISKFTTAILSGAWTPVGGQLGTFTQTVTVPAQISEINDFEVKFYITSTGAVILPSWERATAGSFTVTVNDTSLDLTAVYI